MFVNNFLRSLPNFNHLLILIDCLGLAWCAASWRTSKCAWVWRGCRRMWTIRWQMRTSTWTRQIDKSTPCSRTIMISLVLLSIRFWIVSQELKHFMTHKTNLFHFHTVQFRRRNMSIEVFGLKIEVLICITSSYMTSPISFPLPQSKIYNFLLHVTMIIKLM